MNQNTTARMLLTTAALAAVAALFTGAANAKPVDIDGATASTAITTQPTQPTTIPYLSHGIGVDTSQFSGQPSVGLTGDSALTRSAPESVGLNGDSPSTRSPGTGTLQTASSASDGVDWSSAGLGAGMAALLAAGIAGVVLTTRRRGGIALP